MLLQNVVDSSHGFRSLPSYSFEMVSSRHVKPPLRFLPVSLSLLLLTAKVLLFRVPLNHSRPRLCLFACVSN